MLTNCVLLPPSFDDTLVSQPTMATQPLGEVNHQQQLWDDTLGRLLNLSDATLKRNAQLEARVAELEMELQMWRQAHSVALEASERETKAHKLHVSTLNRQISKMDVFANQNALILCVINGDENLFHGSLLAEGEQGGKLAVQRLTQAIATYLSTEDIHIFGRLSFWITVYFNRAELIDRLIGNNICSVQQFEAFVAGVSQASARFCLVDVGFGGEGTDTKIREYIEEYARFPQTLRVFLAGGHDPKYSSTFGALRNEQLLGKLVLLRSTNDDDSDTTSLSLLSLKVDGLFMPQKLLRGAQKLAPLSMNFVNANSGLISPQSPASHTSARSLDPSHTSVRSLDTSQTQTSVRSLDPSLPLHKQNPPPCNEHYLMTCSKGPAVCKYSHEYHLTKEQLESLSSNAKKAPCNWLKNGLLCPFGDRCCWGHFCPNGPRCFHLSKGKCWFKGEAMHPATSP
ncbi:hypothetical protein C8J57DRAFT_1293585 [Mycena rebaudengoi]|nr:hypothetical protein C8J57DRAFT_1293585 [Mycena rebaudengoi]